MLTKPTVLEFTTSYPEYGTPEFAATVGSAIDDAWVLYSDVILTLSESKQAIAFKYAACHMFGLACWEAQGFNSAPVELSSRNESIRFNVKASFLSQTMCGRKLLQLLKQKQNAIYASDISAPGCSGCGC
jgi:hypothetical protein